MLSLSSSFKILNFQPLIKSKHKVSIGNRTRAIKYESVAYTELHITPDLDIECTQKIRVFVLEHMEF